MGYNNCIKDSKLCRLKVFPSYYIYADRRIAVFISCGYLRSGRGIRIFIAVMFFVISSAMFLSFASFGVLIADKLIMPGSITGSLEGLFTVTELIVYILASAAALWFFGLIDIAVGVTLLHLTRGIGHGVGKAVTVFNLVYIGLTLVYGLFLYFL
jgi:hypothetical protein